ncbi:MAG: tetratricopeptide repeat protein [Flavobacteriales bacterium]|tara:strand:+ start:1751 stop:3451 length:1701 start_codon:yes stop_codon:yes gene_type:complete
MIKNLKIIYVFLVLFFAQQAIAQQNNMLDDRSFIKCLIEATGSKVSGDLYSADSLYKKCLELNPKSGVVNFELSGIYLNLNQPKKALEYANIAVAISPDNEWYLANLALMYKENENHKKSAAVFSKLIEIKPEKTPYLFSFTEELLNDSKYKKALKALDKIEEKIGISDDLSIQKHQIYIYLKDKKNATRELEKLVAFNPENIRGLGLLAEYYQNINKTSESKSILDKMMLIDSSNGLVRLSLFQYFYKNRESLKAYNELLNVMNSLEVENNLKKQMLLQISYDDKSPYNIDQICELAESFLKADFKNSEVLLLLGNLKMHQRKEDTACFYIRESLKINPLPFEAWTQLISSTLSRKKLGVTVRDSKNALESHPNQPFLYLALGIALNQEKNFDSAVEFLKKGKKLVFNDSFLESDFTQQIGDAYYGLKKFKIAFDYYEMSLALNPENINLLNNYSYYLALEKVNLERAKELILKVIEKFPNNSTYTDTYGWVMFQRGEYEEAEKILFKAVISSSEKSGEILEHYGDVLFKLGMKKKAVTFWEKAEVNGEYSKELIQKINENKFIE